MREDSFYLVRAEILPDAILRTIEAKKLLESKQVKTVGEAVQKVGLSRSAFYKYKDGVYSASAMPKDLIVNLSMSLEHRSGVLSNVLSLLARMGTNVLTIHQTIPLQGLANVVISLEMPRMGTDLNLLLDSVSQLDGVREVQLIGKG